MDECHQGNCIMNVKKLQDKLDQLYKNVDPTELPPIPKAKLAVDEELLNT